MVYAIELIYIDKPILIFEFTPSEDKKVLLGGIRKIHKENIDYKVLRSIQRYVERNRFRFSPLYGELQRKFNFTGTEVRTAFYIDEPSLKERLAFADLMGFKVTKYLRKEGCLCGSINFI